MQIPTFHVGLDHTGSQPFNYSEESVKMFLIACCSVQSAWREGGAATSASLCKKDEIWCQARETGKR